jgi:hypothetical protein
MANQLLQLQNLDPGRNFVAGRNAGAQNKLLRSQRNFVEQERQQKLQDREAAKKQAMQKRNLAGAAMFSRLLENAPEGQEQQFYNIGLDMLSEQGVDVSDFPEQLDGEVVSRLSAARLMAADMGLIKPMGSNKSFSKDFTEVIDQQGNRVLIQGSDTGGARVLEGFKPVDKTQQKIDELTRIQTDTPEGRAKLTQQKAKAREAKIQEEKGHNIKKTALNLINDLLDEKNLQATLSQFGSFDRHTPNITQSANDAAARLEQLEDVLTAENLGLMTGVLSETDLKVIANIASGGIKRKVGDKQALKNLLELRKRFSQNQTSNSNIDLQNLTDDELLSF